MRYAIEIEDGVDLLTGFTPLPDEAIEPIPNWEEMILIFNGYLKIIDGQVVEKTQEEKDAYDLAHPPTIEELQDEALQFLNATDWYVIRASDLLSGKAVPEDILNTRAEARALL